MALSLGRVLRSRLALLTALVVLPSAGAPAAIFEVDSGADTEDTSPGDGACADPTGACTLHAAIHEANALAGSDEVRLPVGVYVLEGVTVGTWAGDALTIVGAGAERTTVTPGWFSIYDGPVRLEGLTVDGAGRGGVSIESSSDLELRSVVLRGGSIGVSGAGGRLRIEDSAVYANHWGVGIRGGEICANPLGPCTCSTGHLDLVNSTISGNEWGIWGGAPIGSFCNAAHDIRVENSTIASNSREGLSSFGGVSSLEATVVAHNTGGDCVLFYAQLAESLGHNIDSDGSCGLDHSTDLSGVDPMLGPLQDNSGPTPTHALLTGSPAIDAIPAEDCTYDDDGDPGTPEVALAADQRGVLRPQGTRCDIGSFERARCGRGAEAALVMPAVLWARRRRLMRG